ncbi:hypothetical protein ALC53_05357 [Atta colombica]|uniref:Uncharacterized protein n=1 Tax=Atta colombica TaxID=520822 RepID=A0A195BHI4_9HYME|nr:hypothetical protein ALC53_05357 [Atta colombica]
MPRGDKKNLGGEVGLEDSRATANYEVIQRNFNVAYNCCTLYRKVKKRREKNLMGRSVLKPAHTPDLYPKNQPLTITANILLMKNMYGSKGGREKENYRTRGPAQSTTLRSSKPLARKWYRGRKFIRACLMYRSSALLHEEVIRYVLVGNSLLGPNQKTVEHNKGGSNPNQNFCSSYYNICIS